jgi:hypothetical protein
MARETGGSPIRVGYPRGEAGDGVGEQGIRMVVDPSFSVATGVPSARPALQELPRIGRA